MLKDVLERILTHYSGVDTAVGEEALQLKFEVMLVEEQAAGRVRVSEPDPAQSIIRDCCIGIPNICYE